MFEMMRDGHGRIAIALELDRLGIKPPNPKSRNWAPSSITSIIKNEVYIGNIIWGQVKHVKRNGKYKKIKLPREKWTIKENAHEPLVSPELFEAANRAHSGRWRPSTAATKSLSNPLAGILKCEVCNYTMLYQPRSNRPNDTIRCVNPECKGVQKGAGFKLVEQRVIDLLTEYALDIAVSLTHQPEKNDGDTPYKKILVANKTEEIAQLEEQKSELHDLLERRVYTVEKFLEREQNLTKRINGLQDEINTLNDEIQKEEVRQAGTDILLPKLQMVIAEYWDADIETRNKMLKTVLEKATYLRQKDWNKLDQFRIQIYPKV
jgi:hypothetical protein